ncbi:MAG: class I tRNA ligase family protein, partial [Alphaproteobacteria bacterium]|nr:class I tRNA ligase family protein [Alphaproteobacteria bacterium]
MTSNYNHKLSEAKWQKVWAEKKTFKFDEKSAAEKYYVLEMFPYPSGKIHMGHLRNYTIGDALARFKKMQGFNVLHPMGFDAFGLPAENAALEHKIHPESWTLKNIEQMRSELKSIGLSLDWDREVITCLPSYYKHEQKIFLDFVKHGLAYQKESYVNWDPIDQTVLANEQVIDGRGWRSGALVEKKKLKQWFLKVSDFSEELLSELKNLPGWDERVLTMQEKWIGKSEGLIINFLHSKVSDTKVSDTKVSDTKVSDTFESIPVYTTRPDTLFGASFIAISPNHPIALELAEKNSDLKNFITECNRSAVDEQTLEKQEKRGFKTVLQVEHPLDPTWKLDVYVANFVLMDYGTGAIFGCPAHDERDFEFAKKYNLPIRQVVENYEKFLAETDLINFSDPAIRSVISSLQAKSKDQAELAKLAFEFVRDEINHAMDDKKYLIEKPFLKASEVLSAKVGFCFGKSILLCAILRGLKIPCGFSDQLLMFDENISDRKIIHTVNAIYLNKKWIRVDARGNKPEDVNAEFGGQLAYEA